MISPGKMMDERSLRLSISAARLRIKAIHVEQIESVEDERLRLLATKGSRSPESDVVLQKLKAWRPVFVQRNHFPIKDCILCLHALAKLLRDLRKLVFHCIPASRNHAYFAALKKADCTIAIPLDLVEPVRAHRHVVLKCGQHGLNPGRHRLPVRTLNRREICRGLKHTPCI